MPQDTTLADVADAVSELGTSITEKVGTLDYSAMGSAAPAGW